MPRVRRVPDIGVWMRPDVLQRKKSSQKSSWYFRDSWAVSEVKPGDHLWVSVGDTWVGYFTISGVQLESFEVVWDPSSWVAVDYRPTFEAQKELRSGRTSLVPQLPLPKPCGTCGGPTKVTQESGRERRRCWDCHNDETDCSCHPVGSA